MFSGASRDDLLLILERMSINFRQALRWADPLLSRLYNILAGQDPESTNFLESLQIRHGMRLNLVLSHNVDSDSQSNTRTSQFIEDVWNERSEVGEEERTGRVFYEADLSEGKLYEKYVSVPMASHERDLATLDICEPSFDFLDYSSIIMSRDKEMMEALSEKQDFKSFYEFSVPYRRVSSLLTVHSTSMLAGYNTMPSVLTSTRAALASVVFSIMAERNNFAASMGNQFGQNFNNVDILNAMGQAFPAGGQDPDCFGIEGLNKDWFKMILEMIKEFIYYFHQ